MIDTATVLAPLRRQLTHPRHREPATAAVSLPISVMECTPVQAFEEQARRTPHNLAVQDGDRALTYAQFNAAANRLARYLLDQPQSAGGVVALVMENSADTLIATFAVLKAGLACAIIDPQQPPPRMALMMARADVGTVLTRECYATGVGAVIPDGAALLTLEGAALRDFLETDLALPLDPDGACLIRFTSGSTGEPKRVVQSHRRQMYGPWQYINDYGYGPLDRHALTELLSVSTGSRITFTPLLSGGSIHVFPASQADVQSLARFVDAHAITVLYLPTVVLRELLNVLPGPGSLPSVRMVHTGGQTVYRRDAELFRERFAEGAVLVCRYAMTELGSLAHILIDHQTPLAGETIPAGYPLHGREFVIVDEDGNDLGYDQPGEIAVRRLLPEAWDDRNSGLRRAFAANDRTPRETGLFHTGDAGLLRADGCLIHLGRMDDMVKVRNNRVALAEAERHLLAVPGVALAAIRAFPTLTGDNQLVGYVTPIPDAALTAHDLRTGMAQGAPDYMIPARFVILDDLPRTSSGKIDRQALPAPGRARPEMASAYVPPQSELEQGLCALWQELLDVDHVGIDDDFVDLGGNSLQITRMLSLVGLRFDQSVSLPVWAKQPTVRHLAQLMATTDTPSASPGALDADLRLRVKRRTILDRLRGGRPGTDPRWGLTMRLLAHLTEAGPIAGNVKVPYGLGVKLQRHWVGQPWIRRNILDRAIATFNMWRDSAGISGDEDAPLEQFLINNSWLNWRAAHLNSLAVQERWVSEEGAQAVAETARAGCGAVFAFCHMGIRTRMLRALVSKYSFSEVIQVNVPWHVVGYTEQLAARAARIQQGLDVLARGGAVFIAGDGTTGTGGFERTFFGRHLTFMPGAAHLAVSQAAPLVPIFAHVQSDGRVIVEYMTPLYPAADGSLEVRVDDLNERYVEALEMRWPVLLRSMRWGQLVKWTAQDAQHATHAPG